MFNQKEVLLSTLVFARLSGLMFAVPGFGLREIPVWLRILPALAMALCLGPFVYNQSAPQIEGSLHFFFLFGSETVIGAVLGFGIFILIYGMSLAGELLARVAGLSLADVFDSSLEENSPVFSRLLVLLATVVFFCIGGHRATAAGVLEMFHNIPLGLSALPTALKEGFITLMSESFSLGLRVAAPVVTALLLVTLSFGLLSRTLPQLNFLSTGLGLNALLVIGATTFVLGIGVWAFQERLQPALETIFGIFATGVQTKWLTY